MRPIRYLISSQQLRRVVALVIACVISLAADIHEQTRADTLQSPLKQIERPGFARGQFKIRTFAFNNPADRVLEQFRRGQLTLDQAVSRTLYDRLLHHGIEIRSRAATTSFALHGTGGSREYRFFANNTPFCHYQVKAHDVAGQQPTLMGVYPDIDTLYAPSTDEWPDFAETLSVAADALAQFGVSGDTAAIEKTRCLVVDNQQLQPVWAILARANGRHYRVLADELRSYEIQRAYFDATGMAKVYERNPSESELKEFTLTDLTGNNTMTSTYFTTEVHGVTRANNTNHQFVYSPSDKRFDEASAFTHASVMLKWFFDLGYEWQAGQQIVISVNNPHPDIVNNAQYDPGGGSIPPAIIIGSGDGNLLQNLPRDADVISHELGHHIIYRTLTSTEGESLVLHEGIADFFTFAHSGDACLGESICPANSPVCVVKGKCLRTADNVYKFGDSDLPPENAAHKRSQFISGMLWDIHKSDAIPAADLTKLVLKSLDYLLDRSGYHDFILSLMIADKNLYDGTYGCKIIDAAKARGLSEKISDINCTQDLPSLLEDGTNPATTPQKKSKSKRSGICGVVTVTTDANGGAGNRTSTLLLAIALLAPLLCRRRVAAALGSVLLGGILIGSESSAAEHALLKKKDNKTLAVLTTISWHGDHLRPHNLNVLNDLRRSYPGTHILHLIDAAYWTKKDANKPATTAKIRAIMRPGDEVGLFLQGWHSLLQVADVKPRISPTFWGDEVDLKDCDPDCGREVPLTEYSADDVEKLIKVALQQFGDAGLSRPRSVQVAGWLTSTPILEVLARNGFSTDISSVPPSILQTRLQRYPIFAWLKTRWQSITPLTGARVTETGAGKIIEAVANTAATEFVTPQQVVQLAKDLHDGGLLRTHVIHLNLNQETAAEHYPRWRATMQALQAHADANNLKLHFLSLPLAF